MLEDLGFKMHVKYPAPVHAFLSPNDNGLHGPAKRRWFENRDDFTDDIAASVELLHELDAATAGVKDAFTRNFQLDGRVSFKAAKALICGGSNNRNNWSHRHRECLAAYCAHMGVPAPMYGDGAPRELRSGLDGVYWN